MTFKEPAVYKVAYSLSLDILRFVSSCDSPLKKTLARSLQDKTLELLTKIYEVGARENKLGAINEAIYSLFFIKIMLRLFLDLNLMSLETNVLLMNKLEDLSKQLHGWKKSKSN